MLLGICITLLIDLFVEQKSHRVTLWAAQIVIIVAAILTNLQFAAPSVISLHGQFIRDNFSSLAKEFIYLLTFFNFWFSGRYLRERKVHVGEYYLLGLFSMLGMMILVSGYSLITIYIGLELLSLPLYAMIAMYRNSETASESAMKYFLMSALASALLLYGMSMIYGATSSVDIAVIGQLSHHLQGLHLGMFTFGLVFIVVGIAFKLGMVPFHSWVPDVYQGSPACVALFISAAPKIAGLGMAIRLLTDMLPGVMPHWQLWLIVLCVASMGAGNIMAVAQTNIRRLFAYSSVAQMGYMMLGILAGTREGYAAATYYVLVYSLMAFAAFALLTMLSRKGIEIQEISDLKGLNVRNPWLALMMLFVMFSMAGIPPFVGFFAKLAVLESLVRAGFIWVPCAAVIFAVIGAYYYLRVVKAMYFEEPENSTAFEVSGAHWIVFTFNGLLLLAFGIFPALLYTFCRTLF